MYLDFKAVLDMFAVDLTVYPKSDETVWIDGDAKRVESEPVELTEPFVPNNLIGQYSIVSLLKDVGRIEQYNAIWLSTHEFPTQTIVKQKGKFYRVVNVQDLSNYSNVYMYYMQSEENESDSLRLQNSVSDVQPADPEPTRTDDGRPEREW